MQFTIKKNPVTDTPAYDSLSEQQRCELLARAMGRHYEPPDNMIEMSGDFAANPRPSDPNPFAIANDFRALRRWVDGKRFELYIAETSNAPSGEKRRAVILWAGQTPRQVVFPLLDYDAECEATAKVIGLVLGLWA